MFKLVLSFFSFGNCVWYIYVFSYVLVNPWTLLACILKVLFVRENKNAFLITFTFIKWALLLPCFLINSTAGISKKSQGGICVLLCLNVTVFIAKKNLEKTLETFLSYFSDTHFFVSCCLAGYVTWCLCKYWISVMVQQILCSMT